VYKLLIISLLAPILSFGQTSILGKNLFELRAIRFSNSVFFETAPFFSKPLFFDKKRAVFGEILATHFLKKQKMPAAFCAAELPFFCKIEFKMDKKSAIPIRVRLGSLAYVDWLEGKSRE
jgi:hypothetical protein